MMPKEMRLTRADYIAILNYYHMPPDGLTSAAIKKEAERLLAEKMCRCIKKLEKGYKRRQRRFTRSTLRFRPIAICRDSVINKKNLRMYTFQCERPQQLNSPRQKRRTLKIFKTAKTLNV